MRVAFYAPMKPPISPIPSGDRRIARSLILALETAGHRVDLASIFQSRDGAGDARRQGRLRDLGGRLADRLIRGYSSGRGDAPDIWLTYHLYYKAPDWIGPAVCAALDIPYAVAEASHAPKRAGGPWDIGHQGAAAAIARADIVFGLNSVNAPCVLPLLKTPERLVPLPPFLESMPALPERDAARAALARELGLDADLPWLLSVAMMRDGDKLSSYQLLGAALAGLEARPWQLLVVGDGAARPAVEAALGAARTFYAGRQEARELPKFWAAADIFVWPAINEAYGMALLEAQAAGVPAVAGMSGGVADILADGETGLLAAAGDAGRFSAAVARLLDDPELARNLGRNAARRAAENHGLAAASRTIDGALSGLMA